MKQPQKITKPRSRRIMGKPVQRKAAWLGELKRKLKRKRKTIN